MNAFIGIDLACAKDKYCPISICTFKDGRLVPLPLASHSPLPPKGLGNIATLDRANNYQYAIEIKHYILSVCKFYNLTPKRIALDAPLTPRRSHLKRRLAEQALDHSRISCYATPSIENFNDIIVKCKSHLAQGKPSNKLPHSMQIFMLAGFAVAEVLAEVTEVIEIYPQANAKTLNVANIHKTKKDQSNIQLRAISEYTGWPQTPSEWENANEICRAPMHDRVDAYSAAWIASLPPEKRIALGSAEQNDAIWIPKLSKIKKLQEQNLADTKIAPNLTTLSKKQVTTPTQSKIPKVCPACKSFQFKMWPFGWDAHAAYKCAGIQGDDPVERKRLFKQNHMTLK